MRRFAAVLTFLLVISLASADALSAQNPVQPTWRLTLRADNGLDRQSMFCGLGVQSGARDGYGSDGTSSDAYDAHPWLPSINNVRSVLAVFGGKPYGKDIQSLRIPNDPKYAPGMPAPNGQTFGDPMYEPYHKIWDLVVFCTPTDVYNESDALRLVFQTNQSTILPPTTLPDMDGSTTRAKYCLRMKDNKGVPGAPANGTIWEIPLPPAGQPLNTTWHTITLPNLVISALSLDAAMAEGYQMQFYQYQEPVPEPGSLVVLASGIMGLAGYAIRRRR